MKHYKKTLALSAVLVISISFLAFFYGMYNEISHRIVRKEKIQLLPTIKMVTLEEKVINLTDFLQNKKVLLIYYSSDCPFCEQSFRFLKEQIASFSDYTILAISHESLNTIYSYRINMSLEEEYSVVFLQDSMSKLYDFYGIKTIPTYFIYTENGILLNEKQGSGFLKELMKDHNL